MIVVVEHGSHQFDVDAAPLGHAPRAHERVVHQSVLVDAPAADGRGSVRRRPRVRVHHVHEPRVQRGGALPRQRQSSVHEVIPLRQRLHEPVALVTRRSQPPPGRAALAAFGRPVAAFGQPVVLERGVVERVAVRFEPAAKALLDALDGDVGVAAGHSPLHLVDDAALRPRCGLRRGLVDVARSKARGGVPALARLPARRRLDALGRRLLRERPDGRRHV
mmetsp:Transcript_3103/g.9341  ORF Transcript_3103/g.9341 Transcript_3103/m.9341 type:complete len:220 (+) Transcript_3103:485-1144(+)